MIVLSIIAIIATLVAGGMRGCAVAAPDGTAGDRSPDYSSGIRMGRIVKFSLKGIRYKSWEGVMDMGGAIADSDGVSRAMLWRFSVLDKEVATQVEKAAMDMQPVALHYRQYGAFHPINIDTDYLVDGVSIKNR